MAVFPRKQTTKIPPSLGGLEASVTKHSWSERAHKRRAIQCSFAVLSEAVRGHTQFQVLELNLRRAWPTPASEATSSTAVSSEHALGGICVCDLSAHTFIGVRMSGLTD